MAALLALSAAVAYGVGDFLGGVAARRVPAAAVVLWSHLVGLVLLAALAPVVGGQPSPETLAVGAVAGVLGGGGVAIFYRALSVGAMSVVAPIAALLSAAVPVAAGLAAGERPTGAALGGIGLALGAVVLVSREPRTAGAPHLNWTALGLAVVSGTMFGLFFVALDQAGDCAGVGLWPLVGARVASVSLFAGLAATGLARSGPPRGATAAAIGCGVLDVTANVLYVVALSHGLLSVVSALTALYPASTVLLARYVLGERLSSLQRAGLGLAGVAAVLIAV
jgi:drug/metabolite transporter (DMT)-like permease